MSAPPEELQEPATDAADGARGRIKCVVWDLDNTLWSGTLLEGGRCEVSQETRDLVRRLDERGILQSVASRNDPEAAAARLAQLGLADMFVHPQIGWNPKSSSVAAIAASLNFGLDAFAFVDDQDFERAEVAHAHPQVTCLEPGDLAAAVDTPDFTPRFITTESAQRRALYQAQAVRVAQEQAFEGTNEEFLRTLDMEFRIRDAGPDDLQRAEELTVRTNQLNSTGVTYSYDDLARLSADPGHRVLVADMNDRFGDYGTIGLALVECGEDAWHLRLLLMSCRTMSRGVGTILLSHIMEQARRSAPVLRADFVETGRNRVMQITYAFAGFVEVGREGDQVRLESDLTSIQPLPDYVRVTVC